MKKTMMKKSKYGFAVPWIVTHQVEKTLERAGQKLKHINL